MGLREGERCSSGRQRVSAREVCGNRSLLWLMEHPVPGRSKKPPKKEVVDAEVVEDVPQRAPVEKPIAAEVVEGDVEPPDEELEEVDPAEVDAELKKNARAALARKDPLAAYMAEVTQHPLLTREQEIDLARKYRA